MTRGPATAKLEGRASRWAEGKVFAPLVRRSHELWREMESRSGATLLDACGFLTIDTTGGASNLHGLGGFFERTVDVARRRGIAHEVFDGDEVRRRFPAFFAPSEARAYYEPEGGLIYPERCIEVQLRLAREAGAVVVAEQHIGQARCPPLRCRASCAGSPAGAAASTP